jgi:multicomponent Na+:H+ antiporter subunit B
MLKQSLIVKIVTEKMVPFVLMFGVYIILHGSSSPGGGFQGGVVIGAAFILFAIGVDSRTVRKRVPAFSLKVLESGGVLLYVAIGLVGIILGYTFLANRVAGFPPQGEFGGIFSGGALFGINICIGTHVACTVITLF